MWYNHIVLKLDELLKGEKMSSNEAILRQDEEYVLELRRLYESFGYKKFKMSKFEKYDLYLENKSFLRNANIVTVTDPAGRLLALKPDITLSIAKNIKSENLPEKLYYSENIYISDSEAGEIKETTQVGLEYFGELDIRALSEILLLASESLSCIGDNYRIAVSHMGFVSEILDSANVGENFKARIYKLVSEKNLHGLKDLCTSLALSDEVTARLCGLINVCGKLSVALNSAKKLVCGSASQAGIDELEAISDVLNSFGLDDKFILDFSVLNDVSYYNGLVFQGFIGGVPRHVLSGGRYDNLVQRFGCTASAAGFAVYIDLLDRFLYCGSEYDYDAVLVYSPDCDPADVLKWQMSYSYNGKTCLAVSKETKEFRYRQKFIMSLDGSVKEV